MVTWNEVAVFWERILETCLTVNFAYNHSRLKLLLMASLWRSSECETNEKEYG